MKEWDKKWCRMGVSRGCDKECVCVCQGCEGVCQGYVSRGCIEWVCQASGCVNRVCHAYGSIKGGCVMRLCQGYTSQGSIKRVRVSIGSIRKECQGCVSQGCVLSCGHVKSAHLLTQRPRIVSRPGEQLQVDSSLWSM